MINANCDSYVDSILSETANLIISKFPEETLSQFIRQTTFDCDSSEVENIIKCLGYLTNFEPPHRLILYQISNQFTQIMNLYEFLQRYKALLIHSTLNSIMLQFFKY